MKRANNCRMSAGLLNFQGKRGAEMTNALGDAVADLLSGKRVGELANKRLVFGCHAVKRMPSSYFRTSVSTLARVRFSFAVVGYNVDM